MLQGGDSAVKMHQHLMAAVTQWDTIGRTCALKSLSCVVPKVTLPSSFPASHHLAEHYWLGNRRQRHDQVEILGQYTRS